MQIVEEKNAHQDERTIDLHELHVAEALTCLESFIAENIRGKDGTSTLLKYVATLLITFTLDGKTVIQVITGRGNNSQHGRPRIKPAVSTFLKQKKYA